MLVGLIFENATRTLNPAGSAQSQVENKESTLGFLLQRGRHQNGASAGRVTDINPASQEAFR
jgi:hypothetical protein